MTIIPSHTIDADIWNIQMHVANMHRSSNFAQWQEMRWANMYRGGNLFWWRENRQWTATVLRNEGCPLHWAVLILAGKHGY